MRLDADGGIRDHTVPQLRDAGVDAVVPGSSITYDSLPQVKIHRAHLAQVFQNLIGNAIKYRSEKQPQINVQAERRGGE